MADQCRCSCLGHICNCTSQTCSTCGCGPKDGFKINEARITRCRVHSYNIPYGQSCPYCHGS